MNDRSAFPIHTDLLAQVADSEAEEREVRRILGAFTPPCEDFTPPCGPLTARDLDAHQRWKAAPWPIAPANDAHRNSRACSRCDSGLAQCVTPDACERAELPRPPRRKGDTLRVLAMAIWPLYVVALVAGVAMVWRWLA